MFSFMIISRALRKKSVIYSYIIHAHTVPVCNIAHSFIEHTYKTHYEEKTKKA